MNTRQSLRRALLVSASLAVCTPLLAQAPAFPVPGKPVTIVVGFPAGGGIDALARIISQSMSVELGVPVVIDNRPGAGATIAASNVARAAADGHTLFLTGPGALTIWPHLRKLSYDADSLTPIGVLVTMPFVLVTSPTTGPASVQAIIEAGKLQSYPYASAGPGTANQLSGALFGQLANIKMDEITYRGSAPALVDVMAGMVPIHFSDTSAYPLIDSGKLKPLAVTTKTRSARLPNVPTMEEAGVKDYEVSNWTALVGPAQMPASAVEKINRAVAVALKDPSVRSRIEMLGMEITPGSAKQLAATLKAEHQKWATVIRVAGIKAE